MVIISKHTFFKIETFLAIKLRVGNIPIEIIKYDYDYEISIISIYTINRCHKISTS